MLVLVLVLVAVCLGAAQVPDGLSCYVKIFIAHEVSAITSDSLEDPC